MQLGNITFGPAFKELDKFFVGADSLFDRLTKAQQDFAKSIPAYPPFNIKKTDDNHYVIEIACAGFSKNEVDIELDGDKLVISGKSATDEAEGDFIYRGLAKRAFERTFLVNDKIEVKSAEMVNGLLRITLENLVEANKKVKIAIDDFSEKTRQLLTESK